MSMYADTRTFSKCETLAQLAEAVLNATRTYCGADGATMVLRDGDQCYYVDERAISPLWKGKRFPMQSCISGWVMLTGETVAIPDIYKDSRIPIDSYKPTFVQSLCMAPVGKPYAIAAIGAYWSEKHAATDDQSHLLKIITRTLEPELKRVLKLI